MQRFTQADDLIADGKRQIFGRMRDTDVQLFEIGFFIAPAVVGDGIDRRFEKPLVIRFQPLAGRVARKPEPAGWRDIGFADDIGVNPVWGQNLQGFLLAVAAQRNVIMERVVLAGDEVDLRIAHQSRQRIGFQSEAVGRCIGMHRVTHLDGVDAIQIDLFQKGEEERLVGASDAGADAFFLQPVFGIATAFGVIEGPCFEGLAGLGSGDESIQSALEGLVENLAHRCYLEVLPVGSRLSRSQSPRRLRPSTVSRMARPGKTLTHHAVCR
ncbi:hypothetical protein D3C72_1328390 [compost metagenome]